MPARSQDSNALEGGVPEIPPGMQAALRAAGRGAGRVSPNPMVGAALESPRRSRRVAFHARFGGPHAEARLLIPRDGGAMQVPPGSTLYVTLEPCAHHGKTPPCVDAILRSRPASVVIATLDPDPRVRGRGVAALRQGGILVEVGAGQDPALAMNLAYHLSHSRGRALVRLKLGMSLDARLATDSGVSRWITGAESRRQAHRERARADAVLVGASTVLADDPELTVRHVRGPQPSRIVIDSTLRTPPRCRLREVWGEEVFPDQAGDRKGNFVLTAGVGKPSWRRAPRLVLATRSGHAERRLAPYRKAGWEIWELPAGGRGPGKGKRGISLPALVRRSAREGLLRLLAEAGPRLAGALLAADLVDELSLFQAPIVLGGGRNWPGGWAVRTLGGARRFEPVSRRRLGEDLWQEFRRRGRIEEVRLDVHRPRGRTRYRAPNP